MRLASYIANGRTSFGAVVGDGVVDFRLRFGPRFATLADLLRAHALEEARAILVGVRPDFPLSAVEFLPPVAAPKRSCASASTTQTALPISGTPMCRDIRACSFAIRDRWSAAASH